MTTNLTSHDIVNLVVAAYERGTNEGARAAFDVQQFNDSDSVGPNPEYSPIDGESKITIDVADDVLCKMRGGGWSVYGVWIRLVPTIDGGETLFIDASTSEQSCGCDGCNDGCDNGSEPEDYSLADAVYIEAIADRVALTELRIKAVEDHVGLKFLG